MLKHLKEKYPDEVEIVCVNADGSMVAHLPVSAMKARMRAKRDLTDEQRKEIAERLHSKNE